MSFTRHTSRRVLITPDNHPGPVVHLAVDYDRERTIRPIAIREELTQETGGKAPEYQVTIYGIVQKPKGGDHARHKGTATYRAGGLLGGAYGRPISDLPESIQALLLGPVALADIEMGPVA